MNRPVPRRRFLQMGGVTLASLALCPALTRVARALPGSPTVSPPSRGLPKELLDKVLKEGLARGGEFCDLFLEHSVTTSVYLGEGKIRGLRYDVHSGAGIRVVEGQRRGFAHTEVLKEANLIEAARTASYIARSGTRPPSREIRARPVRRQTTFAIPLDRSEETVKIDFLRRAEARARSVDPRVHEVQGSWEDRSRYVQIANSQGFLVEDQLTLVKMSVDVVAKHLGETSAGRDVYSERIGWEVAERLDPDALGERAAERAMLGLEAVEAPAGPTMTVIGNRGGVMFHEAVGHGLEADAVRKKASYYTDRRGQKVASELVSLIDDATIPGFRGSYNIDDEGVPGQRKVLIRDGVLKEFLYDQAEALLEHRLSTGNGRREGYWAQPQPRMSNTFLKAGKSSPEDIIRSVGKGFYAAGFGGGMVDPASGQFTFNVVEGYRIQDGKIGRPVKRASLVGSGAEVLQNIDMVGNDLAFWPGTCGKGGQWVPVTTGCPTLRVKSIVVGGGG